MKSLLDNTGSEILPPKRNRLPKINLALTMSVSLYAFWLASERTWNPDSSTKFGVPSQFYFWNQAKALMHGNLSVRPPHLRTWWFECFTIEHKCYGYFGITPSILRMPAVLLFGDNFVGLVPVFVAMGIGLAFWASMDLVHLVLTRYAERNPTVSDSFVTRWLIVVGALLGPGSVLILLARSRVYEEAVVWSAAFLCLTLNLAYRWSRSRSNVQLYGVILTGTLAALSRPNAIPALVVLGVAIVVVSWRWGGRRTRFLGVGLAVVPAALYVVIFERKFGSFSSFPWSQYGPYISVLQFRHVILRNNGGTVGLRFLTTTLANYFRPDSLRFDFGASWVTLKSILHGDLIVLPPAARGQIWGDRVPSLTNLMPVPLVLTGIAVVSQARLVLKKKFEAVALMPAFMLLAALAGGVPMMIYYAVAGRYLGDLYPLMMVGTAFSLPIVLDHVLKSRRMARFIFPVAAFSAVASTFVLYQIRDSVF